MLENLLRKLEQIKLKIEEVNEEVKCWEMECY